MFRARTSNGELFKNLFWIIESFVSTANIHTSPSELQLQSMDDSNVALVHLKLQPEFFDQVHECKSALRLGMCLKTLVKLLKFFPKENVLTLKHDTEEDHLQVIYESPDGEKMTVYNLKLMDVDKDFLAIPETDYLAGISIQYDALKQVITEAKSLGAQTKLTVSKEVVKFSTKGEGADVNSMFKSNSSDCELLFCKQEASILFATKYLANLLAHPVCDRIEVYVLDDTMPMLCKLKFEDGSLEFYLAPKIDTPSDL